MVSNDATDAWSSDGVRSDPFPIYAEMRRDAPVTRVSRPNGLEEFLVTRFSDVRAVLADPRLSKRQEHGGARFRAAGIVKLGPHMLNSDPPDHSRLRGVVADAFSHAHVQTMRADMRAIAEELAAEFLGRGHADIMADFAARFPIAVIGKMLGVPTADFEYVRTWTQTAMLPHYDPRRAVGFRRLTAYLTDLIDRIRAAPSDDLISRLIDADQAGTLNSDEVLGTARLLLIAGHDTTVNLIGNGTLALLENPGQAERIRSGSSTIAVAIEELLRYDGPLESATMRFAKVDLEVGGYAIPKFGAVTAILSSANRDAEVFENPDVVDFERPPRRHLAFGYGPHFCLGAHLARAEGEIAIGLLSEIPDLRLAVPAELLRWRNSLVMRGLEKLPVAFTPISA